MLGASWAAAGGRVVMVVERLVQQGFRVSKTRPFAPIFWSRSVEPGYLCHDETHYIPWKKGQRAQGYHCPLEGSANSVVPRRLEVGLHSPKELRRAIRDHAAAQRAKPGIPLLALTRLTCSFYGWGNSGVVGTKAFLRPGGD